MCDPPFVGEVLRFAQDDMHGRIYFKSANKLGCASCGSGFVRYKQRLERPRVPISQGSQKGHYVRLLLLGQLPIEHEVKIFHRVLQRE